MVRAVVVLAVAGLVALVVAALTGSSPLAVVVVALAVAGIVQLVRDWRDERSLCPVAPAEPAHEPAAPEPDPATTDGLAPDEFTPDISTAPDGPSSDARADQG
jgi:choline-glycine betaine transporter